MSRALTLVALCAVLIVGAQALPAGYWCERTEGKRGREIGHRGKCGLRSACKEPGFIVKSVCNGLPDDQLCCLRTPPEPAVRWPTGTTSGDAVKQEADGSILTAEELRCCMNYENFKVSLSKAKSVLNAMNSAMKIGEINTRNRIATWLAQVGAESGSLQWWLEIGETFCPKYDGGCTYKGRGPIQLTHRYNYVKAGKWLASIGKTPKASTIVDNPKLVEGTELGLLTSIWFWKVRAKLNQFADGTYKSFFRQSRKVNGGLRGINHRTSRFKHCAKCLGGAPNPTPVVPGGVQEGHLDPNKKLKVYSNGEGVDVTKCTAKQGLCISKGSCTGFGKKTLSRLCNGLAADIKCCTSKCAADFGGECRASNDCVGGTQKSRQCPGKDVCCIGRPKDAGQPQSAAPSIIPSTAPPANNGATAEPETQPERQPETQPERQPETQPERQPETQPEPSQAPPAQPARPADNGIDVSGCTARGGQCVSTRGTACSGKYSAFVFNQCKGLPDHVSCCVSKCAKAGGQCRGSNDCLGGRQQSLLCPGSGTRCCFQRASGGVGLLMDLLTQKAPLPNEDDSVLGGPRLGGRGVGFNRPLINSEINRALTKLFAPMEIQQAKDYLTFSNDVERQIDFAYTGVRYGEVPETALREIVKSCDGATGAVATHYDFWTNRMVGTERSLHKEVCGRYLAKNHADAHRLLRVCGYIQEHGDEHGNHYRNFRGADGKVRSAHSLGPLEKMKIQNPTLRKALQPGSTANSNPHRA